MFTWKLEGRWPGKVRPNAHRLALEAKLSYPVAVRVLANEPMARIDANTLGRLAEYVGTKRPLSIVEFTTG